MTPGTRLGSYEVVSAIGAGGMGEVYRARDTRLDREVAIKVLPAAFAADAERLARFEREAKLLASLNHTNIAHVYGFESATLDDGARVHFLAMELVEGEDLAERLKRGAIPVDEALAIAKQIAEALEEAHEKGIVHRDLKPANVKVTPDGNVKVLDFGLAKAMSADSDGGSSGPNLSQSPTLARTGTQAGLILGTAAYMSPEQARGKPVDKRADIWAFGVVLFEMLTGRPLFTGETVSDVLASVLRQEIHWAALPASVGGELRRLLERCLERNPKDRLHDIADARIAIDDLKRGPKEADDRWQSASDIAEELRWIGESGSQASEPVAVVSRRRVRERLAWTAAALAIVAAALLGWRQWKARSAPPSSLHVNLSLPEHAYADDVAISRDGVVAYAGSFGISRGLFLRPLNRFDVIALPDTKGALKPFFSPDGQWIGYFTRGTLNKIGVSGGAPVTLCSDCVTTPMGGVWSADDTIYFADRASGIFRISAAGGAPVAISKPDPARDELSHRSPQVLPDLKHLLITIKTGTMTTFDDAQIAVLSIADGTHKTIVHGGTTAVYVPTGHLLFVRKGKLFGVAFDLERLETVGAPFPVLDDVNYDPPSGRTSFAVSGDSLVFRSGQWVRNVRLLALDAAGHDTGLSQQPYDLQVPTVSPDGNRIAFVRRAANDHIVVLDLARQTLSRVSFDHGNSYGPVWTPDGRSLIYWRESAGGGESALVRCPADGNGSPVELIRSRDPMEPWSVSPDGKLLAYVERGDISLLSLADDRSAPFVRTPFNEDGPMFSPDGRWIAYASNESGKFEVYVRSVGAGGERLQVSTDGGGHPRWSRDGHSILYLRFDEVRRVAVQSGTTFSAARPEKLLTRSIARGEYDELPGGRLLVLDSDQQPETRQLNVILGFFDELRRKAAEAH